ncbi:MAG TPA: pirin family protein [Oceanipulchritudo sp.]|nr:pirin family protein [Oceanipulchritudo sp.]
MRIKKAETRGRSDFGWLDSRHSFSFGNYWDPEWVQYGPLRVINDDRVAGGGGFPSHPHRDMEIISIVLSGQLAHRDSMGNGATIGAGEIQYMSAGSGIVHSEMNPSSDEPVHFLQIWIKPDRNGHAPAYGQTKVEPVAGEWIQVIGEADGAIPIRQDVNIHWGKTETGKPLNATAGTGRRAWLQIMEGEGIVNGESLQAGDAVLLENGESLHLDGNLNLLRFDLPAD